MTRVDHVTSITHRREYVYLVNFDDGLAGEVDLADCVDFGPVFYPLKDLPYFRQARVEGGTIAWPNGANIAPEMLHDRIEFAKESAAQKAQARPETKKKPRKR
jgi:hypothetical protein